MSKTCSICNRGFAKSEIESCQKDHYICKRCSTEPNVDTNKFCGECYYMIVKSKNDNKRCTIHGSECINIIKLCPDHSYCENTLHNEKYFESAIRKCRICKRIVRFFCIFCFYFRKTTQIENSHGSHFICKNCPNILNKQDILGCCKSKFQDKLKAEKNENNLKFQIPKHSTQNFTASQNIFYGAPLEMSSHASIRNPTIETNKINTIKAPARKSIEKPKNPPAASKKNPTIEKNKNISLENPRKSIEMPTSPQISSSIRQNSGNYINIQPLCMTHGTHCNSALQCSHLYCKFCIFEYLAKKFDKFISYIEQKHTEWLSKLHSYGCYIPGCKSCLYSYDISGYRPYLFNQLSPHYQIFINYLDCFFYSLQGVGLNFIICKSCGYPTVACYPQCCILCRN